MTVLVSCYWCERIYEEAELMKLGDDDACPYCRSTAIEEVTCCLKCDQRPAVEGSDNCEECDEIVVPINGVPMKADDLLPLRVMREMRQRNLNLVAAWYARYLMETEHEDIRGDLTGPTIDQEYTNKRRLARALLYDIQKANQAQSERPLASVVSIFHRPQAG